MKIKLLLYLCLILIGSNITAQESKFIEVTGSAEMLIEPDEFIFIIGIKEYLEDEFDEEKDFKHYKNKVNINEIEEQIFKDLNDLGIKSESIRTTEVGNYWRSTVEGFLISKKLEISLTDFKQMNKILNILDRRGIAYMRIGELKNKNLVTLRKEVKKQALLAAKEKAKYLLETIDRKLGDIISITELSSNNYYWGPSITTSNTIMNSSDNPNTENGKKIKLRFEINAKFKIE